jgi:hypothetical protein
LLVEKNVAGFDVTVDNFWFQPLMKIGQPGHVVAGCQFSDISKSYTVERAEQAV